MLVFRLEPIDGTEPHRDWRASALKPETVWVCAPNADVARLRVQWATIIATDVVPGRGTPYSPWNNSMLVSCDVDTVQNLPEDMILTSSGRMIPLEG